MQKANYGFDDINIDEFTDIKTPEVVYHYTSPEAIISILSETNIRFTDCHYMNDMSEYRHLSSILHDVIEKLGSTIQNKCIFDEINKHKEGAYKYDLEPMVMSDGKLGTPIQKHYIFSTTTDIDSLNMWNYYVKNGNYEGYNIGVNVEKFCTELEKVYKKTATIIYGHIIYDDQVKKDILSKIITEIDSSLTDLKSGIKEDEETCNLLNHARVEELSLKIEYWRLFFKDNSFRSEAEYRFVVRDVPDKDKVKFGVKKGIISPYLEIPLVKKSLSSIMIAPIMEKDLAEAGLRCCLNCHEYPGDIIIKNSEIPIRY